MDIDDIDGHGEYVDWAVETSQTVDNFGSNEAGAREWAVRCEEDREWRPVRLLRRTVTIETTAWEVVT